MSDGVPTDMSRFGSNDAHRDLRVVDTKQELSATSAWRGHGDHACSGTL